MAIIADRKYSESKILTLFPVPLETGSRYYWEEDLIELGFEEILEGLPEETGDSILRNAGFLANVKPDLAFHFLLKHRDLLRLIGSEEIDRWTGVVLDIFDSKGLNPARDFILKLDEHPDFNRYWGEGISFLEVSGVLSNYLHALGEGDLNLETGPVHYMDMLNIYLPERISILPKREDNFLLYKVMVTHKYAQVKLGTYRLNIHDLEGTDVMRDPKIGSMSESVTKSLFQTGSEPALSSDLLRFLNNFRDPQLAEDLYVFVYNIMIERWMRDHLPGLYRDMKPVKKLLVLKRAVSKDLPPKSLVMEQLTYHHLTAKPFSLKGPTLYDPVKSISGLLENGEFALRSPEDAAEMSAKIYGLLEGFPGPYHRVEPIFYVGELKPHEAERGRRRRRESIRGKFREELSTLVQDLPECREVKIEVPSPEYQDTGGKSVPRQELPKHFLIDGNPVPVPQSMGKIIEEIYEDLGALPASYLAVSDDMSGHSFRSICQTTTGTSNILSENSEGIHVYDEWDYRRRGYKKRWALLRETEVSGGGTAFSEDVLIRYRGMIQRIKRHFERIRLAPLLLRRQREGDNVDLDAAIEAFADKRAGVHPSERLFVRLRRDKREIATAFLIDLSGSTSGWINEMERTSLLILCEALQVIKDRFAIYGFSGRTRKRCELFRIKGFDETYGEIVKRRIANLRALDYTRLGPPIRHLTRLLRDTEASTRLLITLSDGKPDDYDGYKGDYGIEDTRQALVEAKRFGIHPFCITIDRAEHSYLSHMYGPVNYAFIDDISKLPAKVPEIYRKLTT
jgi:nitric oxide reductase NorD protein